MHIVDFECRIEEELREVVTRHFPLDWKEDAITHDFLIRLRKDHRQTSVFGNRWRIQVEWEIYKLHGPTESNYGDIGVLVRYKMPTEETIEGAGFLEAKLRGRDTTKFHQIRHSQITRLLSRSPQTRLLLYDYNPVTVLDESDFSEFDSEWLFHRMRRRETYARVTHGPVLPLQLAATVNHYDDTLYRFCHCFSHQLCRRYLHLHDLDFSERAIRAVKGFPDKVGSPNVVMVIRVAPEGRELPEPFFPNDNVYGVIE